MTTYYKVLGANRMPVYGGSGQWPEPGEWWEVKGNLIASETGLHLCRRGDLVRWLGPIIWTVEVNTAEMVIDDNFVVVRKARLLEQVSTWNERKARLFAADCAEHVLHLYEQQHPDDTRPRRAIAAARACANARTVFEGMVATKGAARAAAWVAAGAAARAAAQGSTESAERAWQTNRLFDYLEGRVS